MHKQMDVQMKTDKNRRISVILSKFTDIIYKNLTFLKGYESCVDIKRAMNVEEGIVMYGT